MWYADDSPDVQYISIAGYVKFAVMIGSISKKINACAQAAGNEPILSWEMESGEKTEVRRWKLEVESQKSEVGSRRSD